MRRLNRRLAVVLVLGCALIASGLLLPWTYNRAGGHRWLVELIDREPRVVVLFVGGLAALALSVTMIVLRSPPFTVLLPALVGALTLVAAVLDTPRPDSFWDGMDSTGRPIGGSDPTLLSFGAAACLVGVALQLVVSILYARSPRMRP